MRRRLLYALVALLGTSPLHAERLVFDNQVDWSRWQSPAGLIEYGDNGALRPVKLAKDIDATANAADFSYETQERGLFSGGLWSAGSNPGDAGLILDGDPTTAWRPDEADQIDDWTIEIDLGRPVLASEISLVFPEEDAGAPFRQFTVFVSTGVRIAVQEDLYLYEPVFRTTRPNLERRIDIPLRFVANKRVLVTDPDLEVDDEAESRFRVIQRVRIEVEEKTPGAALAELSVRAVGDNISLGTAERGSVVNGSGSSNPINLFDGDMNVGVTMTGTVSGASLGWEEAGVWFGVDLGAVFFVDDLFLYSYQSEEGLLGFSVRGAGPGHKFLFSDGTDALQTTLPVPQAFDYTDLLSHDNPQSEGLRYMRYRFHPRRVRYLFWHGLQDRGWTNVKWAELMLFGQGHPARLVLTSPFIDLGSEAGDARPKVVKSLSWDADLPPGTRLQLRSRSGNELSEIYSFHDRAGNPVTEARWTSAPKVLRGRVDTTVIVGQDWGNWSNFYQEPGEAFQSDNPRRFIQLEMILSTDDPEAAVTVNSLSIDFEDALVQGARGRILPRQAPPNADTRFTYTLLPNADDSDSGFDLLRFAVPGRVAADDVGLRIGGREAVALGVEQVGDSLSIALPQAVGTDSVEVSFTTQVIRNATVFGLDLGLSERPGLWQSVEPAERRSDVVLLPALTESDNLIGDLRAPAVFSPNGDGVNDAFEVSFVPFKTDGTRTEAGLFDLHGRQVAALESRRANTRLHFVWNGRDASGALVPPGIYLLRLDLGAASGDDTTTRTVVVAY